MKAGGCPHDFAPDCPLYVALHDPDLVRFGCDDGELGEGVGCAASRRLRYADAVERLRRHDPLFVAQCEFNAMGRTRAEQRDRNLRLNGIH